MHELDAYRCSSCNSADVAKIQTEAFYDELVECRCCKGIYPIEYVRVRHTLMSVSSNVRPKTLTSR